MEKHERNLTIYLTVGFLLIGLLGGVLLSNLVPQLQLASWWQGQGEGGPEHREKQPEKGKAGLTLKWPMGGETIEVGKTYTINWEPGDYNGRISIAIQKESLGSGGSAMIVESVPNTGSYTWDTNQPLLAQSYGLQKLVAGSDYVITLEAANINDRSSFSDFTKTPVTVQTSNIYPQ